MEPNYIKMIENVAYASGVMGLAVATGGVIYNGILLRDEVKKLLSKRECLDDKVKNKKLV